MIDHLNKYKALAKKFNLPIEVVQKICDSQYEFCKTIISSGKDEPIHLQFLGKFRVKPFRRELVQKKREVIKKNINDRKKGRQEE